MNVYGFRVHKNGAAQGGCLTLNYTPLVWGAAPVNDGGYFNLGTGRWRPPAGLVMFGCNIWCQANCLPPNDTPYAGYNECGKIHRYGPDGLVDIGACPGWEPAGYTNTAGAAIGGLVDRADGQSEYELIMYTTSKDGGNDVVIDGNPAHTWWSGLLFV